MHRAIKRSDAYAGNFGTARVTEKKLRAVAAGGFSVAVFARRRHQLIAATTGKNL